MKQKTWLLLPLALAVSQVWAAEETVEQNALDPVVVTGTQQKKANTVKLFPKNQMVIINTQMIPIRL